MGAKRKDGHVNEVGAAYIFDFDGFNWSQSAKLEASDSAGRHFFGSSVALLEDRALIGAYGAADFSGAAYVFDFNGTDWVESAKLAAFDADGDDGFGISVSLSDDRILVGSFKDGDNGTHSGSVYVYDLNGVSWLDNGKLKGHSGSARSYFGQSISLSGNRAVIGANGDDTNGSNSGAVYVFEFDGLVWEQTAKLKASDGTQSDYFGYSVSLSGNRILIGAPYDLVDGSAYIFDFDGEKWTETAQLKPVEVPWKYYDLFGFSVSLSGNRALIGAPEDEDSSGSVYFYEFDGTDWNEVQKFTGLDTSFLDEFGYSVSLFGDRLMVGAVGAFGSVRFSGAAYIFNYDGEKWVEDAKLVPSDGLGDDKFGHSVSLSGNQALVGSPQNDAVGNNAGSAYIFDFDGVTWVESSKLVDANGMSFDYLGRSVSLFQGRALVGAEEYERNGFATGSVYLFEDDGNDWNQNLKLTASDGELNDHFGHSVSLSGNKVLVSAVYDDDFGSSSGSFYVFDLTEHYGDLIFINDFETPEKNNFIRR